MKKFVGTAIVFMLLFTCTISATTTSNQSSLTVVNKYIESLLAKVTIYVNTSAIDGRSDLNDTQKTALKNRIIQHIKDNYEPAVGAPNVSVTNDPSQAGSADRTVQIQPGKDPNQAKPAWGRWPPQSNTTYVYLGEFMNDSSVNGSFKNPDGTWNTTALGNAIGHTAGHEVGHSYSIGHNHNERPKSFAGDNRSKMTVGGNINASERANASFGFDNHSRDVLRKNWGKGACDAAADYDMKILVADFWSNPAGPDKYDEYGTFDARLYYFTDAPGWYELGFLGIDTDDGLVDGNADFDFIYKSSLWMDNDLDAEYISFLSDHHERTTWLLRGSEISPFPGEWFYLNSEDVFLEEIFVQPDGDEVARYVTMIWPLQMVHVTFDSFSFEDTRQMFNGFKYNFYTQNPPNAPNITGETNGKKGKSYAYNFLTSDPDGDKIYYFINWDDGTNTSWIGPYYHNEEVTVSHTWTTKGTYTVSAKVKDYYGSESNWSYLEVTMPRSISNNLLIKRLFELLPKAFPILRYITGF